jgi:hypothetical protein
MILKFREADYKETKSYTTPKYWIFNPRSNVNLNSGVCIIAGYISFITYSDNKFRCNTRRVYLSTEKYESI